MFAETARRIILPNLPLLSLLGIIVGLVIIWIIVSIPVYIVGKVVKGGKASFSSAMAATLFGPIVYVIVLLVVSFFLGGLIGPSAFVWALILAFIAWIGVYKSVFQIGWIGAFAIAVLSIILFIILNLIITAIFGIVMPEMFFPSPLSSV